MQWRKDSVFNKWHWENWTATYKIMKLEHSLTPYIKINSKWIKDLNVKPKTIKLLKENVGKTLFGINCSNKLLNLSPKAKETKPKINKYSLIKLKIYAQQRKPSKKRKGNLPNGRKY